MRIRNIVLLSLCYLCGFSLSACPGPVRAYGEQPVNVVLILADDQSWRDFGFLGNELVHTPHLDAFARTAARYPNGYVPMSVCRPSLASLLTGLYPHQHGIHFNHPPPGLKQLRTLSASEYQQTRSTTDILITRVPTLPRILANHGYRCLQTGKHWEGSYRTAGFTHGMTLARPASRLSPVIGTRQQANGEWVAHGNGDAGLVIGRETMQPIDDFLDQTAGKAPFLIWYAPFLPHTPFDAAPEFHEPYRNKNIPAYLRDYYAEITRFDATVGDLLSMLKRHSVAENTLVIFASDNGFRPDEKRHDRQNDRSKLTYFEDGIRTPILIRSPGRTKADVHHHLVGTTDLVPTILSAVGLSEEITEEMKGIDLMPSVTGQKPLPDRPAFGAVYPNDARQLNAPQQHVRARWVRWQEFKLVMPGPGKSPVGPCLFDLKADPQEANNLYNKPQQAQRIHNMKQLLKDWWDPV